MHNRKTPSTSEPKIIYEDENFLAVNKPSGLQVHAALANRKPSAIRSGSMAEDGQVVNHKHTLVDWLLKKYPEIGCVGDDPKTRPGIVHRLDKETSGVMLVARNQKYFEYLKNLFKNHLIKKTYLAVVCGKLEPKSGTIRKPIGIKSGTIKRSVHSLKMSKDAATTYRVKKYLEFVPALDSKKLALSLVEVEPQTGRTHQIRVHLASIGHPVLGDYLYGRKFMIKIRLPVTRLMLHATSLEFNTRDGRRLKLETEPPEEFLAYSV